MCGRLVCALCAEDVCKASAYFSTNQGKYIQPTYVDFGREKYIPSYNLSPSRMVPVFIDRLHLQSFGQLSDYVVTPMRWGLLPDWENMSNTTYKTHNIKLETMMDLKLPKTEMNKNRRGVLVCDGYYEWQNMFKGNNQPHFFYNKRKTPVDASTVDKPKPLMNLAVIFNQHTNAMGTINLSCSVITKEANQEVSRIHHRMPITLNSFDAIEMWINSQVNCYESYEFLKNYDAKYNLVGDPLDVVLAYHQVDKQYVNNAAFDNENCIERSTGKRQLTMKDWLSADNVYKKK